MVVNIKIIVPYILGDRVKNILQSQGINIEFPHDEYIYVSIDYEKNISFLSKEEYNECYFDEVDIYSFIVSDGEEIFIPQYKEKAIFYNDLYEKDAVELPFHYYTPHKYKPFNVRNSAFRYCKKVID